VTRSVLTAHLSGDGIPLVGCRKRAPHLGLTVSPQDEQISFHEKTLGQHIQADVKWRVGGLAKPRRWLSVILIQIGQPAAQAGARPFDHPLVVERVP
jgi:hypothetical protein